MLWCARLLLGLVFIFSGLMKAIDPVGTAIKIGEYTASAGFVLSEDTTLSASVLLCLYEMLLGFAVLCGIGRKVSGILMALTMTFMTLLTLYIALANPVTDCGCFGDAFTISNTATFIKNLILFPFSLLLLLFPRITPSLLPGRSGIISLGAAALLVGHFIYMSVAHLPAIDFRLYKVGTPLTELTDEPHDDGDYDYRFVYEKDGVERTFNLEELAEVDSTWTFLRDETIELKAGRTIGGADFMLLDEKGKDISETLRAKGENRIIVLFRDIIHHDLNTMEEPLRELRDLALRHGGKLIFGVGNRLDDGALWQLVKIAPTYHIDRTTIKTIVRSDPGVIVIVDGKIIRKASYRDAVALLKDGEFVESPFDTQASLRSHRRSQMLRFLPLSLGAFLCIILVIRQKKRYDNQ